MALTANLIRSAVTAPGTTSTWTDSTVYGGANPDRNEVALYLTAYKVDQAQVETALAVTTFDPEVVTSFITANGIDGWHKYYFVIVDYWLVGIEYEKYDLVWSPTENAFYEYINDTPSTGNLVTNATYFTVVSDPTVKIANVGTVQESGNLVYQVINKILDYQTSICYLKAQSLKAKESCGCDDCGCDSRISRYAIKIRDLFANMTINETTGTYIDGEKNARLASKYCDDCGCLET